MKTNIIGTLIGPDRTGLVKSLSSIIARHEANWLDSRMSHLCGHFTGILHVEVNEAQRSSLETELKALETLSVLTETMDTCPVPASNTSVTLEVVGHDRPGIVQQVAHVIAQLGINVESLDTEVTVAPMSGEDIFTAQAQLGVPDDQTIDVLHDTLESLADDIIVTLSKRLS